MRKPEYIIKIAADSIQQLRRIDVDRVLDNCSDEERKPTVLAILAAHPDYAGEINAYWNDMLPLETHTKDAHCIVNPNTDLCVSCGVQHGEPCASCGGRGFHTEECSDSDANYTPKTAQDAVVTLQHVINHFIDQPEVVFIAGCAIPEIVIEATLRGEIVNPLPGA